MKPLDLESDYVAASRTVPVASHCYMAKPRGNANGSARGHDGRAQNDRGQLEILRANVDVDSHSTVPASRTLWCWHMFGLETRTESGSGSAHVNANGRDRVHDGCGSWLKLAEHRKKPCSALSAAVVRAAKPAQLQPPSSCVCRDQKSCRCAPLGRGFDTRWKSAMAARDSSVRLSCRESWLWSWSCSSLSSLGLGLLCEGNEAVWAGGLVERVGLGVDVQGFSVSPGIRAGWGQPSWTSRRMIGCCVVNSDHLGMHRHHSLQPNRLKTHQTL